MHTQMFAVSTLSALVIGALVLVILALCNYLMRNNEISNQAFPPLKVPTVALDNYIRLAGAHEDDWSHVQVGPRFDSASFSFDVAFDASFDASFGARRRCDVELLEVEQTNANGTTWCCGNESAAKTVFLLSSCRGVALLNFILNHSFFNDCRVHILLVYKVTPNLFENLLAVQNIVPKKVDYFFHEFIMRYGFLNTDERQKDTIFAVPNLMNENGRRVMMPNMPSPLLNVYDILHKDPEVHQIYKRYTEKMCSCNLEQDCGCRQEVARTLVLCRDKHIARYAAVLNKTGLTSVANALRTKFKIRKMFNTINHPSNYLHLIIFIDLMRLHFKGDVQRVCTPHVLAVAKKAEFTGGGYWTIWDRTILEYRWLDAMPATAFSKLE